MEEKKELLDQDERVVEIELERLRGFVNHPFKVQADSQMIELQESIKKYGILNPLIVRPRQDGTYEIISGHRRKFAAEKIGYRKVLEIKDKMSDIVTAADVTDIRLTQAGYYWDAGYNEFDFSCKINGEMDSFQNRNDAFTKRC